MKQTVLISLFLAGSAVAMPPASQSLTVRDQDDAATPESISSLNLNDAANIYARQTKLPSTIQECDKILGEDLGQGWSECADRQNNAARVSCREQKRQQADLGPCKIELTSTLQEYGACVAGVLGENKQSRECQLAAENQAINCANRSFDSKNKDKSEKNLGRCVGEVAKAYSECARAA